MDAIGRKGARDIVDALETLGESIGMREKRRRVNALGLASVPDMDVAKERAPWRYSCIGDELSAVEAALPDGVDVAISAWTADHRDKSSARICCQNKRERVNGFGSRGEGPRVRAWGKFQVSSPVESGAPSAAVADSRWAPTWKIADGKRDAKARMAAKGLQVPILEWTRWRPRAAWVFAPHIFKWRQ